MSTVAVVIPTRNRRTLLSQTLACVLDQDDVDLSVVVVDEGSTDGTEEWLPGLAEREPRLQVVRHDRPRGLAAARNAGLAQVDTPYVAFCDDDDLWAPGKLRAQLQALDDLPGARWSCTGTVSVDADLRIVGHQRPPAAGDVSTIMRAHNAVPGGGSTLVAESELLREVGGYDDWFTGCEDFEVAVKLSLRAPVAPVDRPLVAYRVWPASMSSDPERMRRGHERVVARWRGELEPELAKQGDELKEAYLGRLHLRGGHRVAACRHYVRAAVRLRRPRQLVSAAGALVAPDSLLARHDRRERLGVPEGWREEARAWLSGVSERRAALAA
jgi:glycosyltransferase involved in cell wall biosynthesis